VLLVEVSMAQMNTDRDAGDAVGHTVYAPDAQVDLGIDIGDVALPSISRVDENFQPGFINLDHVHSLCHESLDLVPNNGDTGLH